jgi:hypothetical protein
MAFCAKCGSALTPGAGFCSSCGTPFADGESGKPAPKKLNKRKIMTIMLVGGVALLAFYVFGAIGSGPDPSITSRETNHCSSTAAAYLEMLKRGDSDFSGYWKPDAKVVEIYNVSSYTELGHGNLLQANGKPYKIPREFYQFDVESSTKGGFPIRKHWAVVLEPLTRNGFGRPCAIVDLLDSH